MAFAARSSHSIFSRGKSFAAALTALVAVAASPPASAQEPPALPQAQPGMPEISIEEGPANQIQVIGEDPTAVVANVNGEAITERDLAVTASLFTSLLSQVPREQWRSVLIEQAVALELVMQAAEERGIDQTQEFLNTMEDFRKQTLRERFIAEVIQPDVTDEAVQAEYERLVTELNLPDEIQARVIMVETEADAVNALRRLDNGEDFATLATEISLSSTAENGGLLADFYFTRDELPVQEISDVLFDTEPGTVYPAPINYEGFWYVLKVDDRRQREPPPFDEETANAIRQQMVSQAYTELVEELVNEAEVDVLVPELESADDAPAGEDAPEEDAPADDAAAPADDAAAPAAGN